MIISQTLNMATALLSLLMLVYVLLWCKSYKSRCWLLLAVCIFLYALGYMLEAAGVTEEGVFMGRRVQLFGLAFLAPLAYLFLRDYNDRPITSPWKLIALFALPMAVVVSVNSFPTLRLYYADIRFSLEGGPHVYGSHGPLFYVFIVYCLAGMGFSAYEVLRHSALDTWKGKRKAAIFCAAVIVPGTVCIVDGIVQYKTIAYIGVWLLMAAELSISAYINAARAEDWLPYVHEYIIDRIDSGFLLIDTEGRLLTANKKSTELLPMVEDENIGMPVSALKGFPMELFRDVDTPREQDIAFEDNGSILRASITPIDYKDKRICTSIVLYDITKTQTLLHELEVMATSDPLTGLLNRREFMAVSKRDFSLHKRAGLPGTVMMMDIDYFKKVNDRFGHQMGDIVLRDFADTLVERLRKTDISARYGGEEFCVFLPATTIDTAFVVANDIRSAVRNRIFGSGKRTFHVTVSIGLAEIGDESVHCLDDAIANADAALYRAKEGGRNRVACYGEDRIKRENTRETGRLVNVGSPDM